MAEIKGDNAQLAALTDLKTTFPEEFSEVLKKQGMVGESKPLLHEELLEDIKLGVGKINLGAIQRFKDSVTNILPWRNAARDRAKALALSTKLMQADIEDISGTLSDGQKRQEVAYGAKGFLGKMFSKDPKKKKESAADKEKRKRDKAGGVKTNTLLQDILNAVSGKKGGEDVPEAKMSMFDKLKKALISGALMLLVGAVVAFLGSKYWEDIKKFFVDDFMPFAKMLWEDYLKPIGAIFVDQIMKSWENIKELFTGLKESFKLFGEGKWWEGIKTFFSSIGTFLGQQLDNAITGVYNIIGTIFGLEETDSVFGSIKKFFSDLYDDIAFWIKVTSFKIEFAIKDAWTSITTTITEAWDSVVKWFSDLWTWASEGVAGTWKGITNFITGVWDSVVGWFSKLWTWASTGIAGAWTGITNFIKGVWDSVVEWFSKLWTWASAGIAGTWTGIVGFIKGVWDSVVEWFSGLWAWGEGVGKGIAKTWTGVVGFITGVWDSVVGWFSKLWSWGEGVEKKIAGKFTGIVDFVTGVFGKVKGWFIGLFEWGEKKGKTATGGFSLAKILSDAIEAIGKWFKGLFDIDWSKAIKDLAPKWIKKVPIIGKWFGGDSKESKEDVDSFSVDLSSIAAAAKKIKPDPNLAKSGKQTEQAGGSFASGGPFSKGRSMLVGELGPEMIMPNQGGQVLNAQRTQQMLQAGIQRGMGGGAGGGGEVAINTGGNVVSSPTTNYVNNGTAARRPIYLTTATALA